MTRPPSSLRAAATLAVAALLGSCTAAPDCDGSACGDLAGTVTSVRADGSSTWTAPVRDSEATVSLHHDVVVLDGCRAVTVLETATGRVLLETEQIQDAGAVADGLLVGSARGADEPGLVGVRLDGSSGGSSWSRVVDSTPVPPSPVAPTREGFAVAFGDSIDVVAHPSGPAVQVQLPSPVVGAPAALPDGTVLAATADGSVYGIHDGALRWRVVPELVGSRVDTVLHAVAGGALVSSSDVEDRSETAFASSAGEVRWRAPGTLPAAVLADRAEVVVLSTTTGTSAHDLRSGVRLWSAPSVERGRRSSAPLPGWR